MNTSARFAAIDVFRGIAVLIVLLYHFTSRIPPAAAGLDRQDMFFVPFGGIGVYLFYVISGYCIFFTLRRAPTLGVFSVKRISRIYPAYLASIPFVLLSLTLFPLPSIPEWDFRTEEITAIDVVANMFFARDLGFPWVNGSYWSLLVELKYYVFVVLVSVLFASNRRFLAGFSLFTAGSTGTWLLLSLLVANGLIAPSGSVEALLLVTKHVFIAPYLPFFLMGMLAVRLHDDMSGWPLPAYGAAMLACAGIIYLVLMDLAGGQYFPNVELQGSLAFLLFAAAFTWFIVIASHRNPKPPEIRKPGPLTIVRLGWHGAITALQRVGLVSYSLYLIHEPLGIGLMVFIDGRVPGYVSVPLIVMLCYLLAEGFAFLFEWRFRKPVETGALWLFDRVPAFRRAPLT